MATPGIGDPYWYEWYVGLENVIKMLNSDFGISCVIFQHSSYNTIDDVVVEFADGKKQLCYQVKHEIDTSAPKNLTFGNMLESKNDKKCLFEAIFQGWKESKSTAGSAVKPILFTNRKILNRRSGRSFNGKPYSAYPVDKFLLGMQTVIRNITDYENVTIDDSTLLFQWNELCNVLPNANSKELMSFLKEFSIDANQLSLAAMKQSLITLLTQVFSCSEGIALELFGRLLLGLTEWTTTERSNERVTLEDVYSVLGIEEDIDESQHRLAPPYPFFESRQVFCKELETQIRSTEHKIIFLSGDPGSGKTSTISYLQSKTNLFLLRYHTFKPISPEQHFYNADPGMCTADNLWGTLLIQLRKRFKDRLAECNVPISNKLVTVEMMRNHVIRLLGIAAQDTTGPEKRVFVCIDGIDHAARANDPLSFLPTLPLPNEIPDGVCFVIVGQPVAIYQDQYPLWLSNRDDAEQIYMPKLCTVDIKQLILMQASQFESDADGLADFIYQKTEGNNLSAVFAVEEVKALCTLDEAITKLQKSGISADVQQYYNHIWSHMKRELSVIVHMPVCPESIVACPILLMNGRVNTKILAKALTYGMSESDWTMILSRLYPLVVPTKNEGEYALFHNDFRVFLMGVIRPYQVRYEEIALAMGEYLLQNEEGILACTLGIHLLKCANKEHLIPQYFTPNFVINSLAEGVSLQRLDEFAHLSYDASCSNQDMKGYRNTYLAIKTLYQHKQYFEYFGRNYISNDYPETSSIDISEIRTLPITPENIGEFENVLTLCKKLHSSCNPEYCSRAYGLYEKWFGGYSPMSFVPLCADKVSEERTWEIKSTEVGFFLQHWGTTAAEINASVPQIIETVSDLDFYAVTTFGEQYFNYCIENKKFELAIDAIKAGYVAQSIFADKLEDIYFAGASHIFESVLTRVSENKKKPAWNSFALAMKTTCNQLYIPDRSVVDSASSVKRIYDESCFALVLRAFLLGCIEKDVEDDILIEHSAKYCLELEGNKTEKSQASFIVRVACLLGKYYWDSAPNSNAFAGCSEWLLSAHLWRSLDYSKARRFLLYTLLNSPAAKAFNNEAWFISTLQVSLFDIDHLGMYYKTYILDYLQQFKRLDIIIEYIHALYGENCCKISLEENKVDMHARFRPYGELVEPEMMCRFTSQLKWDVVGYTSYEEYAMHGPSDCFNIIAEVDPRRWKDLGANLYRQSRIAELSSNHAAYEICNNITKAAVKCGIIDYWELCNWDDEFKMNPNQIYHSLFELTHNVDSEADLEAIWILSCGMHSWYKQEDRSGSKCIYDACQEKATALNVDFASKAKMITPQWVAIIEHLSKRSDRKTDSDDYSVRYAEDISAIQVQYADISIEESLELLSSLKTSKNPIDHFCVVFKKILSIDTERRENLKSFLRIICHYLQGKEWTYDRYDFVISSLLSEMGSEAFWALACCIRAQLADYEYQISSRNMQLLFKLNYKNDTAKMQTLLEAELQTQELWVTGNNHLEVTLDQEKSVSLFSTPKTVSELALYILLEQIDTQNARKMESAIYAICLLGKQFPRVMDIIAESWAAFSLNQEECLLIVIARWASDGICTESLRGILQNMYDACAELSRKYYLHSILLHLNLEEVYSEVISYNAPTINHTLPTSGIVEDDSYYERFLSLVEDCEKSALIDSIRRYIFQISPLENYVEDRYGEVGDSKIPTINMQPGEILYGKDKAGQWASIPLICKKARLLPVEDPFILTEMPLIDFNKEWFPDIPITYNGEKESGLYNEQLHDIAHAHITEGNVLLAASLWYPWGHEGGAIYIKSSKIDFPFSRSHRQEFDWCIGNFGLLACEGSIDETHSSTLGIGGVSLFNRVGGCQKLLFGNCQMAPASIWRKIFACHPKQGNPYIWIDQYEREVLWFERIVSPDREARQEAFIRQPILFRWICNESWLKVVLSDLEIYYITSIEPYPPLTEES
ncbi:ATP-binding protein [Kineothrix sp. MB12-C1]|uniref:ATP-binding protein n=1 Tax=Kineothrix sp. MB12-C1 TaxID=3070215 RepID=UPI0027D2C667|nr:ATP-binding protein [Kineothrix sp. MB12-C1]WMC91298.1 ATP-binding protein [Kineothrix sp. MB12-C1]